MKEGSSARSDSGFERTMPVSPVTTAELCTVTPILAKTAGEPEEKMVGLSGAIIKCGAKLQELTLETSRQEPKPSRH